MRIPTCKVMRASFSLQVQEDVTWFLMLNEESTRSSRYVRLARERERAPQAIEGGFFWGPLPMFVEERRPPSKSRLPSLPDFRAKKKPSRLEKPIHVKLAD